ncbi:putative succinate dehydrogenase subunit protein [Phaeoacremonium minimum UCRPA7]|uniref:Succinate dehydrogenase [ubiquinone] cytochrome b small subunit n=1 Tax=Phaeoacremonium minimum (strain UCR-PA7) TaxID=1286976 RepID=R8BGB0_PHAM7|nr:putative succinate dehydrogenase subunit protein [Phaeoacremonium minimum UCRPA7]EON98329.1 putative succinate dehydrogenase subunit protein [Phaeoacremonium minimum UCRPA7]
MASVARSTLLRQSALLAGPVSQSAASTTRAGPSLIASARPKSLARPTTSVAQIAAFHASSRRNILPPLPQTVQGTVNDPAPVPAPSPSHGHYHWTFERLLAAGLVPLTVAPFAAGSLNPTTDAILCAALVIHSHMGFQSIIIDYVPSKRLPKTRKLFWYGLNAATVLVGIGLYEFETTDVGLTEAIKRIWAA